MRYHIIARLHIHVKKSSCAFALRETHSAHNETSIKRRREDCLPMNPPVSDVARSFRSLRSFRLLHYLRWPFLPKSRRLVRRLSPSQRMALDNSLPEFWLFYCNTAIDKTSVDALEIGNFGRDLRCGPIDSNLITSSSPSVCVCVSRANKIHEIFRCE